jgi:DNA polymerase-3 subunit delta
VISNTESFLNNTILKKIFLFYGENRELIEQLNRKIIDQNKNYIKKILYNDDVIKNPDQLANLMNVNNIFGEKFLIIIKNLSESTFTHIKDFFKNIDKCLVILNCDVLKKNSKIRLEFENSNDTIVVPCYNDSEKQLFSFLNQNLQQKKINLNAGQLNILRTKKNLNRAKIIEIISKLEILNESKTTITTSILESICNDRGYSDNEEFSLLSNTSQQEIEDFLNSTHNPLENVIILKNTIFRIFKIIDFSKEKNPIEALEYYKPPIFWKEKEKLKKILKLWKIKDLKKLMIKLNNLETNLKKDYDNSLLYQNNFFTNELFKKTFKSGNNFI